MLVACAWAAGTPVWAGTLEGTAAYRERIALPPDAVFEAVLLDVSRADAPASVLGRATTDKDKPEPNRVDDIGRWRREPDTGRLLLRGGQGTPVTFLPGDGGRTLRKADTAGTPASGDNDRLQRLLQPALIEPRLVLTGMFTYMADAASITLCADGGRLPVAMEAGYKALEAAYLKTRQQPGEAVLVSLDGRITPRPSWRPTGLRDSPWWWNASSTSGLARRVAIRWSVVPCATPTGSWFA
jgi:copper homeostasis protein (lipoprotein)